MSRKLKIFIIGPAFPFRGGPARFNENLCLELMKAGHDAAIISYKLQYPSFLFPGSSQYETEGRLPEGIKVHTLINTVNPLNWFSVASFIKKEKPDFILFRYWLPFFGPSLGTIGRLVRKHTTVLALTDNVMPHEKRPGDKQLTKYFVNSCDGFIAMSKKVLEDIRLFNSSAPEAYSPHPMYETYGQPVSMDSARKHLGLSQGDKVVLFFGLIRHYKGLDILLNAFADQRLAEQDIKLLVAGEFYEDPKPYLDQINQASLKDRVILHNRFIPDDEVKYYFCASDIVAQTYRNATNSGVTMVGYYYDKPMLVSNVGGLSEIVPHEKCGYTVPLDEAVIASSLDDYFRHQRATEFTENVKIEKKRYEWKAFVDKLVGLFGQAKRQ